ncbi:MAG TPA: SsrA-binding protein [Verrucomicrobia bacterium]|nr:MAG: SsrA-binding protein [Lentisphaerae bacterium GWF2_57_35]HBA85665.1 SsrA-binding protein [Verrucomicrobiota bacterium]
MKGSKENTASDTLATNRKARRDYHILEKWEAGIALRGGEVKSLRAHDVSLNESFARIENGGVFLYGFHINPYACAQHVDHDPIRPKRLLLHRREIDKLAGQLALKGLTLVPLRVYLNRGLIKVELALCKGKLEEDKRETLKRKTAEREASRALSERR